jgi:hypothetical protein
MNIWELFGPGTFANTERKLALGEFVDGRELALVLRNNPDAVLPRPIREHMIRWLEGEVNAPRGRKPLGIKGDLRDFLVRTLYKQYVAWLERRQKRFGLTGWAPIRHAEWWHGPPHERAARMVNRRLFPRRQNWRSVLNIISARR